MSEVTIHHAEYIDERTNTDKFYRIFVVGSSWVTQYGRNGTIGTFTKPTTASSPEAALKAATTKFNAKVKKGYNPNRAGTLISDALSAITEDNVEILDQLALKLPAGQSVAIITEPVNAVDLGSDKASDMTSVASVALSPLVSIPSRPGDLTPELPTRPMLASVQPDTLVEQAMLDEQWVAQYKYDGDRVAIEVTNGEIRVLNRQGQEKTRNVGRDHLLPFTALHSGRWVFDGEIVGRTLVLFDIPGATDGQDVWVYENTSFTQRYQVLSLLSAVLGIPHASRDRQDPVVLAPVAASIEHKADFLATAIQEQREGIILRLSEGLYEPGRRSTTLIKHKLIKDADVVVTALHSTKQSATLSVHDANGDLIEVGAASTIGKGDVNIGDVWVVTFLYVINPEHPRMFQPRIVRRRQDKAAAECSIEQFADAGTSKVV